MNIEKLNNRHYYEIDVYYRSQYGISSKITKYENLIFHIEVVLSVHNSRTYSSLAAEIAYMWKQSAKELNMAIGCKINFIDCHRNPLNKALYETSVISNYDARKGVIFHKHYLN